MRRLLASIWVFEQHGSDLTRHAASMFLAYFVGGLMHIGVGPGTAAFMFFYVRVLPPRSCIMTELSVEFRFAVDRLCLWLVHTVHGTVSSLVEARGCIDE